MDTNKGKLTKRELIELANYLYSRYEAKKLSIKNVNKVRMKMDTNHDKTST